jgi:AAA ATPase domain
MIEGMAKDTVIMENFRCFAGRHEVPLAPLTVLVGENSSGKSSFLAAVRLSADVLAGRGQLDFNEPPFELGSWEQIAHARTGRAAAANHVVIGRRRCICDRGERGEQKITITLDLVQESSQPIGVKGHLRLNDVGIEATRTRTGGATLATDPAGDFDVMSPEPFDRSMWGGFAMHLALSQLESDVARARYGAAFEALDEFAHKGRGRRPWAFAPVRTRPARTYNPVRAIWHPEGRDMPMVLALSEPSEAFTSALSEFGEAAGLWSSLNVRRLGGDGDPFQVLVTVAKARRNLIDVGYGVSQVLPIVVELLMAEPDDTFLIQQPEVHLHPRAQAALATLFARLAKERDIQIIVETHSDYFIDRVRMDVRDAKALKPDEVSLLYFELQKGASKIYPISFDELGNVLDAPPSYRRFFLDEDMRFFGAK